MLPAAERGLAAADDEIDLVSERVLWEDKRRKDRLLPGTIRP